MSIIEIIVIGVGLSMDAAAVSLCNGLLDKRMKTSRGLFIAITFGVFQGLMPIIGYFMGSLFSSFIAEISHYIAFLLLMFLGIKMIYEQYHQKECSVSDNKTIFLQAIATSIDALLIGITFVILEMKVMQAYLSAVIISVITFCLCFLAIKLGRKFGRVFQNNTELIGGIILIAIGVKILIEGILR